MGKIVGIVIIYCVIVFLFLILFIDWRYVCGYLDDFDDEYTIV